MRLVFLLPILILLASCLPVTLNGPSPVLTIASEPQKEITTLSRTDSTVMFINGRIDYTVVDEIRKRARELKYVVLRSKGGSIDAGITIATFIRTYRMKTVILNDDYCLSACTLIFQAGVERYAGENSKLMYHGARVGKNVMTDFYKECPEITGSCARWYESMKSAVLRDTYKGFKLLLRYGLSSEFREKYMSWKKDPIWYETGNFLKIADLKLTGPESLKYNIATKIVNFKLTD